MKFAAIDISKGEVSYGPDQIEVMSKVRKWELPYLPGNYPTRRSCPTYRGGPPGSCPTLPGGPEV